MPADAVRRRRFFRRQPGPARVPAPHGRCRGRAARLRGRLQGRPFQPQPARLRPGVRPSHKHVPGASLWRPASRSSRDRNALYGNSLPLSPLAARWRAVNRESAPIRPIPSRSQTLCPLLAGRHDHLGGQQHPPGGASPARALRRHARRQLRAPGAQSGPTADDRDRLVPKQHQQDGRPRQANVPLGRGAGDRLRECVPRSASRSCGGVGAEPTMGAAGSGRSRRRGPVAIVC